MAMSLAAKAAWPLLKMVCDDWGVFEWRPGMLKARLLPNDQVDIAALLEEWVALRVVQAFETGGRRYGAVKDFCTEQSPKRPRPAYPLPRELLAFVGADASNRPAHGKLVGDGGLSPQLSTGGGGAGGSSGHVPNLSGTGSEPAPPPSGSDAEHVPDASPSESEGRGIRNLESESDAGLAAGAPAPSDDVLFEEFWALGPRKVPEDPKMPARTRYLAAIGRGGNDARVINAGRRRFAARCRALGDKFDPRYIAATERWLAEMRWIDEGPPDVLLADYRAGADDGRPPAAEATQPVDPRWAAISKRLLRTLGADVHASWIAPLGFVSLEDGTVRLAVRTAFAQQQIFDRFGARLLACCQAHDASIERLELVHQDRVATVGAERPRARSEEKSPRSEEKSTPGRPTIEQKFARAAVMAEGVAQLNGYEARGETRAIATLERWAQTVGGDYVLIARLLDEAKVLGREGADALQWLEQQVGSHAAGGVLPLKPVEAKHAPVAKRGGNGKRRRA